MNVNLQISPRKKNKQEDILNKKARQLLNAFDKKKPLTEKEKKEKEKIQHEKEVQKRRRAKRFYSYFPKKYRETIETEAKYAGFDEPPCLFIYYMTQVFLFAAGFNLIYLVAVLRAPLWLAIIPPILILSVCFGAPYIIYTMLAESRRKQMETMLPDILMLASANIKSGLTIDRALLFAARPEFGALGSEFKKVAFEIYGGNDTEESFTKLTTRIKSQILERTISLLIEGLRSGGAVAKLLEETATDIKNTEMLQREIRSSVMMYTIFIFMAAVLGAPVLFAISNFLITSSSSMWSDSIPSGDMSAMPNTGFLSISAPQMNLEAFGYFSIAAIILTTLFSGILIALIQSGKAKNGIKYTPIFMTIALVLFFAVKHVLLVVFGGMLGMS